MLNRVIDFIAERQGIDPATITRDSKLADLGVDSLTIVELVMELEEEGIRFRTEPTGRIETVGDLVDALENL